MQCRSVFGVLGGMFRLEKCISKYVDEIYCRMDEMAGKNLNGMDRHIKNQIEEGKKNQEAKPPTNMSKTDQRNETKRVQKE